MYGGHACTHDDQLAVAFGAESDKIQFALDPLRFASFTPGAGNFRFR
jgi:hypothetical protein